MPKPKGTPKTGGRIKGTPNKPKPYMEVLEATLEKYINEQDSKGRTKLEKDLVAINSPKDRLYAVEKFLNYIKPKKQAVQADLTTGGETPVETLVISLLNKKQ